MGLTIQLLGTPSVRHGAVAASPPRGRKVWALLVYLLLNERPPGRRQLTDLLFPDSEDPLRALRWNLTELRRLLGPTVTLQGEPVVLTLPADAEVDVFSVRSLAPATAGRHPSVGEALLDGVEPATTPAFATWLLAARHHERAIATTLLHKGVDMLLAGGDAAGALTAARRLVELEPFDERAHALLVRTYVAAGDEVSARQQIAAATELFRTELDAAPTSGLSEALADPTAGRDNLRIRSEVDVQTRLEAGEAAMQAGLTDAGLAAFRSAVRTAHGVGDGRLELHATAALGAGLVHAGQGQHALGRALLEATAAQPLAALELLASVHCDLAWAAILEGQYGRAQEHLGAARTFDDEPTTLARVDLLSGWLLSDTSRYEEALRALDRCRSTATMLGSASLAGWAATTTGRVHLLRHQLESAAAALEEAAEIASRAEQRALLSAVEKLMGTLELRRGGARSATHVLEHAYGIAQQARDVTLLAGSERGLALVDVQAGDSRTAMDRLLRARHSLARTHGYRWQAAWVLDTLCELAVSEANPHAHRWVGELAQLAARVGAPEFTVRAHLHRYRLSGEDAALHEAHLGAEQVTSDHLNHLVQAASDGGGLPYT